MSITTLLSIIDSNAQEYFLFSAESTFEFIASYHLCTLFNLCSLSFESICLVLLDRMKSIYGTAAQKLPNPCFERLKCTIGKEVKHQQWLMRKLSWGNQTAGKLKLE